ncbi:MAG: S9 family peptidase, partial [Anaerolineales bacterium]|nr:S9 family peptidase [Anaerolineales bacterium]
MIRIESLLSARLFLVPQIVGDRIYFISNLNGRMSLYAMNHGGSVPEPLLPPDLALQNPHLMSGRSFVVYPELDKILVFVDNDGDEQYQPMVIPTSGGYPEPAFGDTFAGQKVFGGGADLERNLIFLIASAHDDPNYRSYLADVGTGELTLFGEGVYGPYPSANNQDYTEFILSEQYGMGDGAYFRYRPGAEERPLLYGKPMADREPGEQVAPVAINTMHFIRDDSALLFSSVLFDDTFSLGLMPLDNPNAPTPVPIHGLAHTGLGELEEVEHLHDDRYLLHFNIDGCSWAYEAALDEAAPALHVRHVLVGQGALADGVLESIQYDKEGDRYALSFSTAVSPTQIYTLEGADRDCLVRHTNEYILGIPADLLSAGEDASFTSHDGLRISARLYLPAESLGFRGPRPLVYYIHGGPQSQERPDFGWFSMPLIQFLTLNGFAVFVPNVRGSTGYGFSYTRRVVRDWGGQDRLDHVHAMTEVLPQDARVDTGRAAVIGRSYGGFMTLTLAGRHPELWSAAVDMFGPYDLMLFMQRLPETWQTFFHITVGHPEKDRDFLVERSPRTHLHNLACPMLVIQGKNDPRVTEVESAELVEELRGKGKTMEYLMLPDEGHDVLKFDNRVRVYNAITDFFRTHLR